MNNLTFCIPYQLIRFWMYLFYHTNYLDRPIDVIIQQVVEHHISLLLACSSHPQKLNIFCQLVVHILLCVVCKFNQA